MKHHAPATARNREPIREVLARVLPSSGSCSSSRPGTGEHAVYFGAAVSAARVAAERSSTTTRSRASRRGAPRPRCRTCARRSPRRDASHVADRRADAIALHQHGPHLAVGRRRSGCSRGRAPPVPASCSSSTGRTGSTASSRRRRMPSSTTRCGARSELGRARRSRSRGRGDRVRRCAEIVAMPANNHSLIFRASDASLATTDGRHVPQHPHAASLQATDDPRGDSRRVAAVRPEGQRDARAEQGSGCRVRARGRADRRGDDEAPRRAARARRRRARAKARRTRRRCGGRAASRRFAIATRDVTPSRRPMPRSPPSRARRRR